MAVNRQFIERLITGGVLLLIAFASISTAQTPVVSETLSVGKPVERPIKGGETQSFHFHVKAGHYARVEVEQEKVDLIVSLFDPDGQLVVPMDGKGGKLWYERVSCIAKKSGSHRIEIKAYGRDEIGSFRARLAENRPTVPLDRKRIDAEEHLAVGRTLYEDADSTYSDSFFKFDAAVSLWNEIGDQEMLSISLLNSGLASNEASRYQQAIPALTEALKLFQSAKDRKGQGYALHALGDSYLNLDQHQKAIELYEKSLALRREIGDRRGEGETLKGLGDAAYNSGRYENARTFYEQALVIRRERGEAEDEAELLDDIGDSFYRLKQYSETLEVYEKSLAIWIAQKNPEKQAEMLAEIADCHEKLGQREKAIEIYYKALGIHTTLKDRASEADIFHDLGHLHLRWGKNVEAAGLVEKALLIAREIKNRKLEGTLLNDLGDAFYNLGQYQKSRENYDQALAIKISIKDREGEAEVLSDIGDLLFYRLGEYVNAADFYRRSLAIWSDLKERDQEADALNSIAKCYDQDNQYGLAIEHYTKALNLFRDLKNRHKEADALNSLGYAYNFIGEQERAISFSEQALAIAIDLKSTYVQTLSLYITGDSYLKAENFDKALEFGKQALKLSKENKYRFREGLAHLLLAKVYTRRDTYDDADSHFQAALTAFREIGEDGNVAMTLLNLESFKRRRGNYQRAEYERSKDNLAEAALLYSQFPDGLQKARIYRDLKTLYNNLDNEKLSITFGKLSIKQFQAVRGSLRRVDSETQKSFFADNQQEYRTVLYSLMQQERLPEAHQILNLFKDQQYFDSGTAQDKPKEPTLTANEIEFIKEFEKKLQEYAEIKKLVKSPNIEKDAEAKEMTNQSDDAKRAVSMAVQNFLEFLKLSEAGFLKPSNQKDRVDAIPETKALQEVVQRLSDQTEQKTVAVYAVDYEDEILVLLISSERIRKIVIPSIGETLSSKAIKLWAILQTDTYDPSVLSHDIYQSFFKRIEKELPADTATILWSLDGNLRYVPMGALFDGKQYLAERYNHVNFTRADAERMTRPVSATWTATGLGTSKQHTVSLLGDSITFDKLPGVTAEFEQIFKPGGKAGLLDGHVLRDASFDQKSMLEQMKLKRPVVHIASHFSFRPGDEARSFLLMGDGSAFTLADMKKETNMFAGVELLTLSACNTAAQQADANGREIDGFAELAQRLGANSVMATLWPVADASTPWLMREFYSGKLDRKLSKAESLRQAQLALLRGVGENGPVAAKRNSSKQTDDLIVVTKDGRPPANAARGAKIYLSESDAPLYDPKGKPPFAHPHYWAPFILFGNWQ